MKDQYQQHIIQQARAFISQKGPHFDKVFDRLINPDKSRFRNLLIYVDHLLDISIHEGGAGLGYFHLHFPSFDEPHDIILEYICIKFFLLNARAQEENGHEPTYLRGLIEMMDREISRETYLSSEAKKKDLKLIVERKKQLKTLKKALLGLQALDLDAFKLEYRPTCLINVLLKDKKELLDTCSPTPYFMDVDDFLGTDLLKPISYVLLNDKLNRDELDHLVKGGYKDILENIRHVILFNSDGRSTNRLFNHADLTKMNNEGLDINTLIILSFDRKPFRLDSLISHLNNITTRFLERLPDLETRAYTITPFEIYDLLDKQAPFLAKVEFLGQESLLWQSFQERINEYEDLYELISIKMRNIYSLCCNDLYKTTLLDDIFSILIPSKTLSPETKERLTGLSKEDLHDLKDLLSNVLEQVQEHRLIEKVADHIHGERCTMVLPYLVFKCPKLLDQIKGRLKGRSHLKFIEWKDLDPEYMGRVIIVDYRDPGRYPFDIYPNIFEYSSYNAKNIRALFLTMFFKYNYGYAMFEYHRILYKKVLSHPIRSAHFKWSDLVSNIGKDKPDSSLSYLWDLNNSYTGHTDRDLVVVTMATGSKKSFFPSQLFVAKYDEDHLFPIKAGDIKEQQDNKKMFIQPLDELYEGLNLFETTVDEESEIKQLKKELGLLDHDPEAGLWKVLLKRKAEKEGEKEIYLALQHSLTRSQLPFVREGYFIDHWLQPKSDLLIPRSKRVFRSVCTYLGLPEVYFRVMLKKRARERLASRKSNAQMDQLIAVLVSMGMFDTAQPDLTFDNIFITNFDLEDIGFDAGTVKKELYALVDLCKSNLALKEIISIELRSS